METLIDLTGVRMPTAYGNIACTDESQARAFEDGRARYLKVLETLFTSPNVEGQHPPFVEQYKQTEVVAMVTLYTPGEVAELLSVKESTVKSWLRSGVIPGIRIGKFWRVAQEDLEQYIHESKEAELAQSS
jgi:excisionase family DNA binding protein